MDLTGAIWRMASFSGSNGGKLARNLPGVEASGTRNTRTGRRSCSQSPSGKHSSMAKSGGIDE